jgi:prolyl-tRNA synthetase
MGCYGIGVNRILAAAVERGHDANGIVWPMALAPYQVLLAPLQVNNAMVAADAAALEERLTAAGYDVLCDDRDLRPGVKFKDADLIGIPLRVVLSERGLKDGTLEVKWRHEKEAKTVPAQGAADAIGGMLREAQSAQAALCETRHAIRRSNLSVSD